MDDIEKITSQSKKHLKTNGWLIFEHGYDQKQAVYNCFQNYHFNKVIQLDDLSGQARMTAGSYNESSWLLIN